MEAARRQPMLEGLSNFLIEHERCGAGFDVTHPVGLGGGHITIACRGCGARHDYATATIEFEREIEFAPVNPSATDFRREKAAIPLALSSEKPTKPAPSQAKRLPAATPARRNWKPEPPRGASKERIITAGLLVLTVASLAFAVIRIVGGGDEPSGGAAPVAVAPPTSPPPRTAPRQGGEAPAAVGGTQAERAQPRATPPPPPGRTVTAERFSITVPKPWTQRAAAGGLLLAPPGSSAVSLQVFYEADPDLTRQLMAEQTAAYLRSRDPGATVSTPQPVLGLSSPGFELRARGPAGTQVALAVLADPYRYLVIESVNPGTPRALRSQADQALASFRPR